MRAPFTTRETLNVASVAMLQDNARVSGDAATVRDCATILDALRLNQGRTREFYDHADTPMRGAIDRVVTVLRWREAAALLHQRKTQLDLFDDERCVGCGGEPIKGVRICESCAAAEFQTHHAKAVVVAFPAWFELQLMLELEDQ